MSDFEDFYSDADATGPGIFHIGAESRTSNSIRLKISGNRLLITITGEPASDVLLEHFQQGLSHNLLAPNMVTLVDMRQFIGIVNWAILSKVRDLAPWGEDVLNPSRTAFLVRESNAEMVVKAVTAIFPKSLYQTFREKADAIAWLAQTQT
jgi:hypothetical protein